eukprot:scaffold21612_cov115-Isochrysis_galbana.AAC.4
MPGGGGITRGAAWAGCRRCIGGAHIFRYGSSLAKAWTQASPWSVATCSCPLTMSVGEDCVLEVGGKQRAERLDEDVHHPFQVLGVCGLRRDELLDAFAQLPSRLVGHLLERLLSVVLRAEHLGNLSQRAHVTARRVARRHVRTVRRPPALGVPGRGEEAPCLHKAPNLLPRREPVEARHLRLTTS